MNKVLEGVKIVELSTHVAASWTGKILADMGADVIKVESIGGEPFRKFGPVLGAPLEPGENPVFQLLNGGKKGICLNLKTDEGKKILFDLIKDANVFFSNNRMGALERMGLGYEDVKKVAPHIVYGHISGYGLKGADANLPGFDGPAFWARSGLLLDTAFEDAGISSLINGTGDMVTGLALASGISAALNKQAKTGEGELVLVSLFGVSIGVNALNILTTQEGYKEHFPKNRYYPTTPLCTSYVCKGDSGAITLTLLDFDNNWPNFCMNVIKRPDMLEDPHCVNSAAIKNPENNRWLTEKLIEIFKQEEQSHWAELLTKADLTFSPAKHFKDVQHDFMAWENGYLSRYEYANGHTGILPSTPVQLGDNVAPECKPAPELGEHVSDILKTLGYDDARIEEMLQAKIVG